jgi:hypothetical protein
VGNVNAHTLGYVTVKELFDLNPSNEKNCVIPLHEYRAWELVLKEL